MKKEQLNMIKILLIYTSFIIACFVVVIAFMTATTYTQLAIAILLYPPLIYFAFQAFPRKTRNHKPAIATKPSVKTAEIVQIEEKDAGINDIDKRAFLKLIGGIGLSLFLFSLFNKKAEGLFLKNAPSGEVSLQDMNGNKINPAKNQPTDGYRISDIDDNTAITYYGFVNENGAWFIMKEDHSTGSFRYVRGDSNFPGGWNNREHLRCGYYHNVF